MLLYYYTLVTIRCFHLYLDLGLWLAPYPSPYFIDTWELSKAYLLASRPDIIPLLPERATRLRDYAYSTLKVLGSSPGRLLFTGTLGSS